MFAVSGVRRSGPNVESNPTSNAVGSFMKWGFGQEQGQPKEGPAVRLCTPCIFLQCKLLNRLKWRWLPLSYLRSGVPMNAKSFSGKLNQIDCRVSRACAAQQETWKALRKALFGRAAVQYKRRQSSRKWMHNSVKHQCNESSTLHYSPVFWSILAMLYHFQYLCSDVCGCSSFLLALFSIFGILDFLSPYTRP